MQHHKRTFLKAASAALLGAAAGARAHGNKKHPGTPGPTTKEQKDWGIAGDARSVKRSIQVRMLDSMRFVPDRMVLRLNDTVRFTVSNTGTQMHEFVIGTKQENEAHAALMMKFPDMEHDEPYMAHVPPGKRGTIVWTFNRPGEFEFACLIAGHYQAGMVGVISVRAG
jgi:uncharacterized cupredoxin-like copper-binding protein